MITIDIEKDELTPLMGRVESLLELELDVVDLIDEILSDDLFLCIDNFISVDSRQINNTSTNASVVLITLKPSKSFSKLCAAFFTLNRERILFEHQNFLLIKSIKEPINN